MSYLVLLHRSPSFNCPAFFTYKSATETSLRILHPFSSNLISIPAGSNFLDTRRHFKLKPCTVMTSALPNLHFPPTSDAGNQACFLWGNLTLHPALVDFLLLGLHRVCTTLIPFCHPGTLCLRLLYVIFGLPRSLSNHFPRFKCPLRD